MDEIITTCVQQQIRVFENHEEFRNDIQRFMRLAKIKESHLVVFPELSGLLLAPPLAPGLKRTLLRVAERQVGKKPSLFDRMVGRAADSAADALGGIAKGLTDAVIEHESTIRDAYFSTFSEIAHSYGMYVVGGSIYLPDRRDGQMHNTAYLFSPSGDVIGQQSKINLGAADKQLCQPGIDGLSVFETDFGRLGILIGQDVLYPETSRILATSGAMFIVSLLAATSEQSFLKARHTFSARVQENLVLGAQSCLVGRNILGETGSSFVGKSVLLAPLEMTTRYSGKLGEVGTTVSESIISAAWDINGLYALRNSTDTPTNLIPDDEALQRQLRTLYGAPAAEGGEETPTPLAAAPAPPIPAEWDSALIEEPSYTPDAEEAQIPETAAIDEALPITVSQVEPSAEWGLSAESDDYASAMSDTAESSTLIEPETDGELGTEPDVSEPAVTDQQIAPEDDSWAWSDEGTEQAPIFDISDRGPESDEPDDITEGARDKEAPSSDLWWMEDAPHDEGSSRDVKSEWQTSQPDGTDQSGDLDAFSTLEDAIDPIGSEAPAGNDRWLSERDEQVDITETSAEFPDLHDSPTAGVDEIESETSPEQGEPEAEEATSSMSDTQTEETDNLSIEDKEDTQHDLPDDERDDGSRFGRLRSWLGKRDN